MSHAPSCSTRFGGDYGGSTQTAVLQLRTAQARRKPPNLAEVPYPTDVVREWRRIP